MMMERFRDEEGQVMLEYLIITIFVVIPMIMLLTVIVNKLATLYSLADLALKIPTI